MSASVHIRPARHGDAAAVASLVGHDRCSRQAGEGGDPARVARLIEDPRGRLLIATSGSTVVGAVALTARSTLTGPDLEAWVDVLSTAGPNRDCVAQLLLQAAERAATELGCSRLVTECTVARTPAHRLFEAHGWIDVHPVSRRLGRTLQPSPGLVNRFVSAAALAASEVSGAVASATGRGRRDELRRAAADHAAAALEPLGVPVHAPGALVDDRSRSFEGWWIALLPLDGACNAARRGSYAFACALIHNGEPEAGVVVELTSGRRWIGIAGAGATVDGRPCCDATTPVDDLHLSMTGAPPRPLGTSEAITVELCELAGRRGDDLAGVTLPVLALHQLAAPLVVLRESGLVVTDAAGSPPVLRADRTWMADLRVSAGVQGAARTSRAVELGGDVDGTCRPEWAGGPRPTGAPGRSPRST